MGRRVNWWGTDIRVGEIYKFRRDYRVLIKIKLNNLLPLICIQEVT